MMRLPHAQHTFTDAYAAGVYVYLWADIMAADIADAFLEVPGGLYDPDISTRWRATILSNGNVISVGEPFRQFRGRAPDATALLCRYPPDLDVP